MSARPTRRPVHETGTVGLVTVTGWPRRCPRSRGAVAPGVRTRPACRAHCAPLSHSRTAAVELEAEVLGERAGLVGGEVGGFAAHRRVVDAGPHARALATAAEEAVAAEVGGSHDLVDDAVGAADAAALRLGLILGGVAEPFTSAVD
jgi:hypothetical protein